MGRLIDADELSKDDEVTKWVSRDAIRTGKQLKMFSELFLKKIADAPTVDAQPVIHAEWINHTHTNGLGITFIDYECDACHEHIDTWKSDFCPNCGAKMDKEQNND